MRLYSFVNFYLSPLQHGLQTAHAVAEMSLITGPEEDVFSEWAAEHKTIIILNGGNQAGLEEILLELQSIKNDGLSFNMPIAPFEEDEESLNFAMTAVSIVVPAEIYEMDLPADREPETPDERLAKLIRSYRLA